MTWNRIVRPGSTWTRDGGADPVEPTPKPEVSVSLLPAAASAQRPDAGNATTERVTATVVGGAAPIAYLWTRVSGDLLTIDTPVTAGTTFSASLANGQTKAAVYRLTATDAAGLSASADVTVSLVSTFVTPPPPVLGTINAAISAVEARDTIAASATVGIVGFVAATEARDTMTTAGAPISIIPPGYLKVWEDDLKARGTISLNETQNDAGKANVGGIWSPRLWYSNYGEVGTRGFGNDGFIDPFAATCPTAELLIHPLGPFEILKGTGLTIWARPASTAALANLLETTWGAAIAADFRRSQPMSPYASGMLSGWRQIKIKPPFFMTFRGQVPSPTNKPFAALGWTLSYGLAGDKAPWPGNDTAKEFEIDLMETFDNAGGVNNNVHWNKNDRTYPGVGNGFADVPSPAISAAMHNYSVHASLTDITFYYDNQQTFTVAVASLTEADYAALMYPIMNLSAGWSWPNYPGPSTGMPLGAMSMVVESVAIHAPPSNTSGVFPGAVPGEPTPTFRAAYLAETAPEDIAVGTVLADLAGDPGATFIVREPSGVLGVSGSTFKIIGPPDFETQPSIKYNLGSIGSNGVPSYGRERSFSITDVAEATNWWEASANLDLDFQYNRYWDAAGSTVTLASVLTGGAARDAGGLNVNSGWLFAAGLLKTLLQRPTGAVLVVFSGHVGNFAQIISPDDGLNNFTLLAVTGTANDGLVTDFTAATLGSGLVTGTVRACIGWDTPSNTKRLAGNGGMAATSTHEPPPTSATGEVVIGRSKFGDNILGAPAAAGRILRIIGWNEGALPSGATITARSLLG